MLIQNEESVRNLGVKDSKTEPDSNSQIFFVKRNTNGIRVENDYTRNVQRLRNKLNQRVNTNPGPTIAQN